MKWRAWVLPLLILTCVTFFLWKALFHDVQAVPSPLVGKPVPELSANDLYSDNKVNIESYLGKPYIIHVFASWCGYCEMEHVFWVNFKKHHKITLVGIDYRDDSDDARAWLKKLGNPYDVVMHDRFGFTSFSLGVYGTPETFLVDKGGVVRQRWVGPINEAIWKSEFSKWVDH